MKETTTMEIKLTQEEMCKAVEYWLNESVLTTPVVVSKMVQTTVNQYSHFDLVVLPKED
jgi:hypothetical protein